MISTIDKPSQIGHDWLLVDDFFAIYKCKKCNITLALFFAKPGGNAKNFNTIVSCEEVIMQNALE